MTDARDHTDLCRGVEIETRPSRLGLGRVSVLRGEGPLTAEPCIDDYIRATEPIFDYMTKWSGLVRCISSVQSADLLTFPTWLLEPSNACASFLRSQWP